MACCVCRLPFVPNAEQATSPLRAHFPDRGILTDSQYRAFRDGQIMGSRVYKYVQSCTYFSSNMFGCVDGGMCLTMVWEYEDSVFVVMHNTCATLFRIMFQCEEPGTSSIVTLSQIEEIIGRPQAGARAGFFKGVDYPEPLKGLRLESFWTPGVPGDGENVFEWKALVANENRRWLVKRPDVFPRFFPEVSVDRLAALLSCESSSAEDIISKQPIDILSAILPFLDERSYVHLTSTCRGLRYKALTVFQPFARRLVLGLLWATPAAGELADMSESKMTKIAHPVESPHSGDWFLYLSHIHRTDSMRVRHWIWTCCQEIRKTFEAKLPSSGYADLADGEKSPLRLKLEASVLKATKGWAAMAREVDATLKRN
ncbi:hypothetical protein C8J56DRAFT_1122868 [Mycena floridula]|nr:hypothetical protein C8J56DRAFT_1122868 [Mycena floridula]